MRIVFAWCFLFCFQLLNSRSTDLKRWVIGDCFYVLMVPMEGLINTHSMENSCSYPTEHWKTWLLSRLYCLCFIFLIYSLKGYFCSLHMTNKIPYGKKELDKGSRNTSFHLFITDFFLFWEWEFHLIVFLWMFNFQAGIWYVIRAAISDKTSCCNIYTWKTELYMYNEYIYIL